MNSKTEAEKLINSIKQEYNLEGYEQLRTILTECLKLLSEELYDTSTHFLQELLQNADDNSYDCPNPKLVFTYKLGSLRVDSNETGFTASNIKAICSIHQSTKLGRKGYIGEKGIGFKSVFKVADVVWVSSNKFSFKFDKGEPFGLIAPTWAEFPEQTQPHQTSFFLQLSQDSDADTLIHDLIYFDPSFILFLRQIKEVVLHIEQHGGSIDKVINRKDEKSGSFEIRTLTTSNSIQRYIFISYEVTDLPKERKRPDYTKSEIVLAFPIMEPSSEPQLGIQNVFSSLPISSYGLRFLLQGDFLLAANRLHINVSSAWNCALRDALPQSFVQAIKTLNNTEEMKYTWPYFVPDTDTAAFFQPSRITIIEALKREELLENFAGNDSKPESLFFVDPIKFCDENGVPFTHQNSSHYLSSKYPEWTINSLISLGVQKLTDEEFVKHLESMLRIDAQNFQNQSIRWHSQLSRALIGVCGNSALREQLSKLALIPLSNGKWSSAEAGPLIFSVDIDLDLAASLSTFFDFVDKSALVDTARIELVRRLGAKEMDKREICRYIVDAHASENVRPEEWTREQLVLHAAFLVEQRWETPDPIDLWFATSDDKRCKGSKLYIYDNPKNDPSTRRVFEKLQKRFPMLHEDYLDQLKGFRASQISRVSTSAVSKMPTHDIDKGESSFPEKCGSSKNLTLGDYQSQDDMSDTFRNRKIIYLRDTLHLSTIPRLVVSHQTDLKVEFDMSEDFKFILSECSISDVFQILNDNWGYYSKWLGSESLYDRSRIRRKDATKRPRCDAYDYEVLYEKSRKKLIKDIGDTEVKLESGRSALGKTFLPNLDSKVDLDVDLPILKLHNANSKAMQERIARFGITVEASIHYYMASLESIHKTHATAPPRGALSHIYKNIESLYDDNEEYI
ncbi:hypothetical protein A0O28_0005710 [Trichoderma guizhouense]|uniref:Uncharacterized protein n=1 Tax=Trichoderma guizhouense TaxID=1491466 RepID=A0A1T3CHF3_9HYPO|nr:hypothetical protein A0O28_0005710 [Trichoderma guizhouense]